MNRTSALLRTTLAGAWLASACSPAPSGSFDPPFDPVSLVGPDSAVGVVALTNLGSAEDGDYQGHAQATSVLPAHAWTGLRLYGEFTSTVGTGDYPSAGVEVVAEGVRIPERAYDPANEWIEPGTVHAYTDGDIDETRDYLEPAFVHRPDGLHLGLEVRVNESLPEVTYVSADPVLDWGVEYDEIRWALDPATGIVEVLVDGVSINSGSLTEGATGRPPSLPLTLTEPAGTTDIMVNRGPFTMKSFKVSEYASSTVLIGLDVTDAAGDRDQSFESHGRLWTGKGYASSPFPTPVLPKRGTWASNNDTIWNLASDQSATWVLSGLDVPWAARRDSWWARNLAGAALDGEAGWGFARSEGDIAYGFLISDGKGSVIVADANELPTGRGMLAAVLDRHEAELRLYTWTPTIGFELVESTDASQLGAVVGTKPVVLTADLTGWAGFYDRALRVEELEWLARQPSG